MHGEPDEELDATTVVKRLRVAEVEKRFINRDDGVGEFGLGTLLDRRVRVVAIGYGGSPASRVRGAGLGPASLGL